MKFFRITDPIFIPRLLLEQIKDRNWDVDDFYSQLNLATGKAHNSFNQNCFLYVMLDEPGKICGFLWLMFTSYNKTLWVNNYSVDRKHWNKGICLPLAFEKVSQIMKLKNADVVHWITQTPRPFEAFGFVASQKKLMTYSRQKESSEELNHPADASTEMADGIEPN